MVYNIAMHQTMRVPEEQRNLYIITHQRSYANNPHLWLNDNADLAALQFRPNCDHKYFVLTGTLVNGWMKNIVCVYNKLRNTSHSFYIYVRSAIGNVIGYRPSLN